MACHLFDTKPLPETMLVVNSTLKNKLDFMLNIQQMY